MKLRHILLTSLAISFSAAAQSVELLPYGDMNSWVTRDIKESAILGGKWQKCYAVGPTKTIRGDKPYVNMGGSPWASSNVMAKVMGVTKVSNSVYPADNGANGQCARLVTDMQHCKAIGVINVDVVVTGSLFLGRMLEPISSTKDPYSKMEMGIEYTRRPVALVYDFKLAIPAGAGRTYSSGFGKKRQLAGEDKAEVFIYLQRRWEDADGNLHAKRVGTGRELLGDTSGKWFNGHKLVVHYGDISGESYFRPTMGLIPAAKSYYATNSHGKMVPVVEEGWDSADATPTHMMVMFSSGSGEPYMGTLGTEFLVDNISLQF